EVQSSGVPADMVPPRDGRNSEEDFSPTDMGNEQLTAPRRKKKKYEILASAHPAFARGPSEQQSSDESSSDR
ncbi:unnamed protein product, partial [Symbiodinium microadriaticum]